MRFVLRNAGEITGRFRRIAGRNSVSLTGRRSVVAALYAIAFVVASVATISSAQSLEDRMIEYRLDNGMLFLLVPMPNHAPVFSGVIMVKVGGVDEQIGQTGLAHMFEHMAFKGTPWIGTTDYESEQVLLERIDSVAVIYTRLMASIPMEQRDALGSLERRTLEAIRSHAPEELDPASAVATALAETLNVAGLQRYPYLDTYIRVKELSATLADLNEQHRAFGIKDEFSQIVMVNGGVGFNAGTGKDYTVYYESFPANRLDLWMLLESQRFMYPVMREFYSERDVVIEERRMRSDDDPDGKLYENFMASAMIAHPYARPIIGWRSDIEQATAQEALDFRNRYYVPENSVGVLVGNFDVDEAKRLVTQYFGRIPAAEEPVPEIRTIEPPQAGERRVFVEFDAEPQVMIGFHKPNYPNPEGYAFRVIANILRDVGNSSRFYQ
ncbi:MAG TPA: insulinase family protein, partial [Firmicutes bacterium]|nr:insulinase family protein [Bacillota bacterium]